jgi:endonuclease-8
MPEGDTVHLTAERLHAALAGERLLRTELRVPAFATSDLSGQTVRGVVARGKHLLLRTDAGLTLHTHLRMEGRWRLVRQQAGIGGRRDEIRVLLVTEPWTAIGSRLGVVELLPTDREDSVVGHLGPDPLGPDWDPDEALRRLLLREDRPIGEALLDQTVMAGPGNVYRCEALFLRGLDPWTPVGAVPMPGRLVDLVRRLMEANRSTGAQITTGDTRPGRTHWVYGRGAEPCRRCGTPIRRRASEPGPDGEQVTFWCPQCQPERPDAPPPDRPTGGA